MSKRTSKKKKQDSPEEMAEAIIYIIYKSSLTDKRQIIVDLMNENPELYAYVYEFLTDTQREIILDNV
jgi:hypothetical protein